MSLRRWLFGLAAALGLAFCLSGAVAKPSKSAHVKRYHITLRHVNTKERLTNLWMIRVDPKNTNKQWVGKRARKRLTQFLRDWRTGKSKRMPERLLWNLYLVGQRFDAPIEIISAYRHNERKSSRHKQGKAIDFRVVGVDNREVWNYCKRFDNVGLGLYPNSNFVHMDVRDRSYYWIDDSGPGEEANYKDGVAQRKQKARKKGKKGRTARKRNKSARTSARTSKKKSAPKKPSPEKQPAPAPEPVEAPTPPAEPEAPEVPAPPVAPTP